MVGSANGRSIVAFTSDFPRKSSRTRTQAISVPITASIAATTTDTPSVNFSAATAGGFEIASQKSPRPPSSDFATTAARGISTMTVSQPTVTAPAAAGPHGTWRVRRGGRRVRASLVSGDPQVLLDLRHRAGVGVEELGVHGVPAAELVDREELLRGREGLLVDELLLDGAVAVVGEDPLRLVGSQPGDERPRLLLVLGLGGDRDRVLDQDRLVRDHVVEVDVLLLAGDRLVLVGEHDV